MSKEPLFGTVAKCCKGYIGLITSIMRFPTGAMSKSPLYFGICLDLERAGQQWQSIEPEIIAKDIDDWVRIRHRELVH